MASIAVGRPLLHRVSWGTLFAGFFVGFGIWLLLLALGAGIGLASFDPKDLGNWQGLGIGFGSQLAETAASAGTRGAWAFFLYGVLTLGAAALGGGAGVPRGRRIVAQEERTPPLPDRPLSPQRV